MLLIACVSRNDANSSSSDKHRSNMRKIDINGFKKIFALFYFAFTDFIVFFSALLAMVGLMFASLSAVDPIQSTNKASANVC